LFLDVARLIYCKNQLKHLFCLQKIFLPIAHIDILDYCEVNLLENICECVKITLVHIDEICELILVSVLILAGSLLLFHLFF